MVQLECDASRDIEAVRQAVGKASGLRYMHLLVRALVERLGVAYAFMAERSQGDREVAQTLAVAHRGGPVADFVFLLAGTPCQEVVNHGACRVPAGVHRLYPGDGSLRAMGAECYVGILIAAHPGWKCGWLGVMDTAARPDAARLHAVLEAMAERTGRELANLRHARSALAERQAALEA